MSPFISNRFKVFAYGKKSIFLTCSYILNISPWTNCTECIYINFHGLRIEICLGCLIPWLQVMNRSLLQKRWVKALSASTDAEVSLQRIDCKWISQLLCPWSHFQIPFSLVNTCNSVWAYFYTKQLKKTQLRPFVGWKYCQECWPFSSFCDSDCVPRPSSATVFYVIFLFHPWKNETSLKKCHVLQQTKVTF